MPIDRNEDKNKIKVLFVCLGNICRSPLAEGVMRDYVIKHGLELKFMIDSAGTSRYHNGCGPDIRSVQVAKVHGIKLDHKARQMTIEDFFTFDYILVMDHSNYEDVLSMSIDPENDRKKIFLFKSFDPIDQGDFSVPDPYYGVEDDFEDVYETCERGINGFIQYLRTNNQLL